MAKKPKRAKGAKKTFPIPEGAGLEWFGALAAMPEEYVLFGGEYYYLDDRNIFDSGFKDSMTWYEGLTASFGDVTLFKLPGEDFHRYRVDIHGHPDHVNCVILFYRLLSPTELLLK